MMPPSPRGLDRRGLAAIAIVALALHLLLAACGGATTGGTPSTTSDLTCLTSLSSHCCELESRSGTPCVAQWNDARACASWPSSTPPAIYPTPCHGYLALRVQTSSYASVYIYDAASYALVAIGDNAAMTNGSTQIECGAGPTDFTVPRDCSAAWLVASTASACDARAPSATSIEWCAATSDAGAD